jgi:hypothetical protein
VVIDAQSCGLRAGLRRGQQRGATRLSSLPEAVAVENSVRTYKVRSGEMIDPEVEQIMWAGLKC